VRPLERESERERVRERENGRDLCRVGVALLHQLAHQGQRVRVGPGRAERRGGDGPAAAKAGRTDRDLRRRWADGKGAGKSYRVFFSRAKPIVGNGLQEAAASAGKFLRVKESV
jgi:hypothetical protein